MKATQQKPPFSPVILTLETQEEVDAIFSLVNFTRLSAAVNLPPSTYEVLKPFRDKANCDDLHNNLCDLIGLLE